jgi:hypothetical protein
MVSELTGDEPELKLGDSGEGVMLLQVRLYGLGIYQGIPDGTFNMMTENAVRELQSQLGQDNDGEVTRQTWEAVVYFEQQYGINYQYQSPYDALAQLQFDLERPELSSGQYRSDAGTLSEDGQWQWDGSGWQPLAGAAGADSGSAGHVSEDGQWRWDGSEWQPAQGAANTYSSYAQGHGGADSYAGQLSPDGQWQWDGTDWKPATEQHGHQVGGHDQHASHDSYVGQLSPDGQWRWDGHQWQAA